MRLSPPTHNGFARATTQHDDFSSWGERGEKLFLNREVRLCARMCVVQSEFGGERGRSAKNNYTTTSSSCISLSLHGEQSKTS